jgi:hypothetical protein
MNVQLQRTRDEAWAFARDLQLNICDLSMKKQPYSEHDLKLIEFLANIVLAEVYVREMNLADI